MDMGTTAGNSASYRDTRAQIRFVKRPRGFQQKAVQSGAGQPDPADPAVPRAGGLGAAARAGHARTASGKSVVQ